MRNLSVILALFAIFTPLLSQESTVTVNHEGKDFQKLKHTWKAQWITHPDESTLDYGVFLFRKQFNLSTLPENFTIHLSADNRYRLYVNGEYITYGPAVGDINHYRYETLDISDYLKKGKNAIAAEVVNFGEYRRGAQQTFQTAFILQSECDELPGLNINTGNTPWKVMKNRACEGIPFTTDSLGSYYVAGPGEKVDAKAFPWGWNSVDYDDSGWHDPKPGTVEFAVGRGFLYGSTWFLVPRLIPLMEEHPQRFSQIVRTTGMDHVPAFIEDDTRAVIPPGTRVSILLDHKKHTTGFPVLTTSKGKGARIKITYAEALYLENPPEEKEGHFSAYDLKRNRNETEGKVIRGYYDIIQTGGGMERTFKPLARKTFRFIQLDIETASEELILVDYLNIFAGYPFEEKASFRSDDPVHSKIWDAAWLTMINSSEEQFFDPYYEQLQYIGDTRIEALISIYVSGDDRLMRKAIEQFDDSRIPDGLTQSRYPSYIVQIIPTYSLLWIGMIHDYFMYRNDEQFVQRFIPGIKSVLDWFTSRQDSTGMVTDLEWWNFTDWAKGFPNGIPPGADDGYSANVNLQLVSALKDAVEIFQHFQMDDEAEKYRAVEERIRTSVLDKCYSEEKQLIAETPDQSIYSQHTNIWAILTNTFPDSDQADVMQRVLSDTSLIQTTIYFKFYLFRALQKCGLGDQYLSLLDPWKRMLENGMTTFGERDGNTRSECHAWSSSPCFDFLHTVAGIYPLKPGFETIAVHPNFGTLEEMEVYFPHPLGKVKVDLKKEGNSRVKGLIILPEGSGGEFLWNEKLIPLIEGENRIDE
ncbi:MAG: alpha-L-rhamnosidase N-terminal domain-containing protein [Bacteroidota bacterium]